ncbi:MAG: DUF655 domain-containing protein [Candidatus Diapherotrites archaeon]
MMVEDNAIVLDFMPRGKGSSFKPEPLAQVLGTSHFTLLEVVPKEGVELKAFDSVYIGKEERDKIDHIKRRINFKDLTSNSVAEIEKAIEKIIREQEQKFVEFFNNAQPISIKRHKLELLPGLGKKHLMSILSEREKEPFTSFKDIQARVHLMPDTVKTIAKRVTEELEGGGDKHFIFARPPAQEHDDFRPRREFSRGE